jgi:hypothetical protein
MVKWVATWVVVSLLIASLAVTVCLYLFVDSAEYGWALTLTFRILWGCWIVALFAIILTRITIFGWSFRRYFRWDEPIPPPTQTPRPTRAPWNKGGKSSFGFTVSMVSVTGTAAVAIVVLWMLEGVIGNWTFWLLCMIIGTVWWVTVITLALTRIAIFGSQRSKAARQAQTLEQVSGGDGTQENQPVTG